MADFLLPTCESVDGPVPPQKPLDDLGGLSTLSTSFPIGSATSLGELSGAWSQDSVEGRLRDIEGCLQRLRHQVSGPLRNDVAAREERVTRSLNTERLERQSAVGSLAERLRGLEDNMSRRHEATAAELRADLASRFASLRANLGAIMAAASPASATDPLSRVGDDAYEDLAAEVRSLREQVKAFAASGDWLHSEMRELRAADEDAARQIARLVRDAEAQRLEARQRASVFSATDETVVILSERQAENRRDFMALVEEATQASAYRFEQLEAAVLALRGIASASGGEGSVRLTPRGEARPSPHGEAADFSERLKGLEVSWCSASAQQADVQSRLEALEAQASAGPAAGVADALAAHLARIEAAEALGQAALSSVTDVRQDFDGIEAQCKKALRAAGQVEAVRENLEALEAQLRSQQLLSSKHSELTKRVELLEPLATRVLALERPEKRPSNWWVSDYSPSEDATAEPRLDARGSFASPRGASTGTFDGGQRRSFGRPSVSLTGGTAHL